MLLANAPAKIVEPFAVNATPSGGFGGKRTVPVPSQIGITPGAASFDTGFPPTTMTPLTDGGVVMSGLDMNGALFQISAPAWWFNAGGSFQYDPTFSTAIGGYPKGSRLLNAAGTGFWISIVDNNVTDPDTGGAGWIPDRSGTSVSASVYASAQQTLAPGNAKILWDTVEFDTFGLWNSGNQRFQALWSGKYRFSGSVSLPSPAGQNFVVFFSKNGTVAKQCMGFPQVSDQPLAFSFDAVIACTAGDFLEAFLQVATTSVLAGQVGTNQAFVYGQIEYMGA